MNEYSPFVPFVDKLCPSWTGGIAAGGFCTNGHVVISSYSPDYEIPEGTPCSCGLTVVRYETCSKCGHKRMEMIPLKEADHEN